MSVTREQFDSIRVHRQVYLETPGGRVVLCELLASLGLFQDPDDLFETIQKQPQMVTNVVEGLKILKRLGVWTEENMPRLVNAMAALPMPTIEQETE